MGLHGGYGIVWVLKDWTYPDKRIQAQTTLGTAIVIGSLLLAYWWIPFATFSRSEFTPADAELAFWASACNVVGIFLMIGADVQKYTQLKFKKGLIHTGLFSLTRNPNYLGEMLIYFSFALISKDCWSYIILIVVWCSLFLSSFLMKELSFMKKEGWKQYKENSLILLPRISQDYWKNYLIYVVIGTILFFYSRAGGIYGLFIK